MVFQASSQSISSFIHQYLTLPDHHYLAVCVCVFIPVCICVCTVSHLSHV